MKSGWKMDDVNKFISQFTDKNIGFIVKQGRRYFLTEKKQQELSKKTGKDFFSIGLFLGESKNELKPSPALIDLIAKLSDKKVFITKKAEWLFLCGRDVFEESIVKKNVSQGLVLVQNERDENLGYGKILSKGDKIFVKNILDKGAYLRYKH